MAQHAPAARELERTLVRLGTGVAEEDLAAGMRRSPPDEPINGRRDLRGELVAVEVGHVTQGLGLLGDRSRHRWVRVPEGSYCETRNEVQVTAAVAVVKGALAPALERDGCIRVGVHQPLPAHGTTPVVRIPRRPRSATYPRFIGAPSCRSRHR